MRDDTVREELQTKIVPGPVSRVASIPPPSAGPTSPPKPVKLDPPLAPPPKRVETASLAAPKTSPTLVDFQLKEPAVPEWRLQMQNAVQQRRGSTPASAEPVLSPVTPGRKAPVATPTMADSNVDPRMAAALKRIEHSRKSFVTGSPTVRKPMTSVPKPAPPMRPFAPDAVSRGSAAAAVARARVPMPQTSAPLPARPVLAEVPPAPELPAPEPPAPTPIEMPALSRELPEPIIRLKRDTNKLPPMEETRQEEIPPKPALFEQQTDEPVEIAPIRIKSEHLHIDSESEAEEEYDEEIEDLAPFSMRFGAGLFDLIIGSFASLVLLSPLAFNYGDWFSPAAILTACGTLAVVMFLYMTVCVGFFGKTPGMRLFSLELVDAAENEYPTLHQAAINSSVFLLSLVFAGAGFATMFFNEEKRALHDLLSGTVLVREF